MSDIQFRIAAKTDVGLERSNNEDNFQVSANLEEAPMKWVNNQQYTLGRKGALLVVADGMGGMNAGEVASEIAINTVRESFAPEKITDEIVKNRFTIEKYMKGVIIEADKRIKEFAKENPDSRGMGTTIVIAWLFDGNLYVSWCGDSRAYIYNPNTGLFQISKDHSYVQELVDAGKISKEDAFDFPDSNIITRSLSDSTPKANPDCLLMPQKLCNNDIILLCSDGLNGMIRDEEIEKIIISNQGNMTECVDALIKGALDAAGADNCTVALCQILSGGETSVPDRVPKEKNKKTAIADGNGKDRKVKAKYILWIIVACVLISAAIAGWYIWGNHGNTKPEKNVEEDTVTNTSIISAEENNDKETIVNEVKDANAEKTPEIPDNKKDTKPRTKPKNNGVSNNGEKVEDEVDLTPIDPKDNGKDDGKGSDDVVKKEQPADPTSEEDWEP